MRRVISWILYLELIKYVNVFLHEYRFRERGTDNEIAQCERDASNLRRSPFAIKICTDGFREAIDRRRWLGSFVPGNVSPLSRIVEEKER